MYAKCVLSCFFLFKKIVNTNNNNDNLIINGSLYHSPPPSCSSTSRLEENVMKVPAMFKRGPYKAYPLDT